MSKSKDLREAAIAYQKSGHTYDETGDLSNKPLNRSFKKTDLEKLKVYVAEQYIYISPKEKQPEEYL